MPKRKAVQLEDAANAPTLRRSTRRRSTVPQHPAVNDLEGRASGAQSTNKPKKHRRSELAGEDELDGTETKKLKPKTGTSTPASNVPNTSSRTHKKGDTSTTSERSYWLMKAEPESRLENGTDVKFSIDDLAARTEPEPWDGIRNYAARNNLRAMKKGDLAFFYHSNCKNPGIAGTMEIVQEHSPDLSAHDPGAPYYDASDDPANPKWSVVHVKFRSKFKDSIGLKELRELGKMGGPLENMQMLRQSRLSVSRVSLAEWEYLIGIAKERGMRDEA